MFKKVAIYLVCTLLSLGAISLVMSIKLGFAESLRITVGTLFLIFIPGFVWSFVFFPDNKKLDFIERILLSFALSIALGPMVIFFFNKLGVKINLVNIIWEILFLVASGGLIYYRRLREKCQKNADNNTRSYLQ